MTEMNRSESIEALSMSSSRTSLDYEVLDPSDNNIDQENQIACAQLSQDDLILKILQILGLDDSNSSKMLVEHLIIKGRRELFESELAKIPDISKAQISNDHSELLDLLKDYIQQDWQSSDKEWFQRFLEQQKATSNTLYDQILTRTAEYGSKFIKDDTFLSLTIQFLFQLDDVTIQNHQLFDDIWNTLVTQGRQGIKKYSEHIPELESDESPLYLALSEYFRQSLDYLFKKKEVNIDLPELNAIALDCVIKNGWWNGLNDEEVKDLLAPKKLKILLEKLKEHLTSNNIPFDSTTSRITTASESSMAIDSSLSQQSNIVSVDSLPIVDDLNDHDLQQEIQESEIILKCIKIDKKLELPDLVEAGELMYIDQSFEDVLTKIIQDFELKHDFVSFINDCLTPMMYWLKRHQSLDDFTESLFYKYSQVSSPPIKPELSLRMIIHVLLLNSDLSLSRMIMSLLNKRNPVPFVEPSIWNDSQQSYHFVSDIIHVWDYFTPTVLSFGIGECFGKSTLLNSLFMSSFEQHAESIYFQNTIDIDFGYSFSPRRSTNIADAHGLITKELFNKIHELFDGFIIHVEYTYLINNFDTVLDLLKVLNLSETKFQLLIIRDVAAKFNDQCSKFLSPRLSSTPSIQTFILPNIADQQNRQNQNRILALREKISDKLPTKCWNEKTDLENKLKQFMDIEYTEHLNNIYSNMKPLKEKLILAALDDSSNVIEYFPEYSKFVDLCELKLTLAHINFYGHESDAIVFDVRRKIYELANTITGNRGNRSIIFDLFLKVLNASNMLTSLELLTTELKQERARLVPVSEMAKQLPIQKSLSLEVLWRNAIVCSQHQSLDEQKSLYGQYYEYIKAGFPFEIIDGDNFYFQYQFLLQALAPFQNHKILVISVIGPQNSGKSTLLNYMFGSLFDVRDGRCTRGIYGSFVKSNRPEFDYIMLLDTEGLLVGDRKDRKYDHRIVLFCLAVSHLVIVNMIGEFSSGLETIFTLCTDSLKQIGVSQISKPVIHFILNQKADLNIENNLAAIDRIMSELRTLKLDNSINIRKEAFHTLPSAFKKEGQSLTSNRESPNAIKTAPDFIKSVQSLCGKIMESAKLCLTTSDKSFDPLQWLTSSITIFDTLQKFSDLTYYHDIHERHLDNKIREYIRNDLMKHFSSDYRDQLIKQSLHQNEDEIKNLFQTEESKILHIADENIEKHFKQLEAPKELRDRSRDFLNAQIRETFNALRTWTIAINEREKVKLLVHNGTGELQKLIDDTINEGTQMTSDDAAREFDKMFDKIIESIKRKFVPIERLNQAIKHIYTNYNMYEKECLPDYQPTFVHLEVLASQNDNQVSIDDYRDKFILYFTNLAYEHCPVTADHFDPIMTHQYSVDIIKRLVYLHKELLEQHFSKYVNQNNRQSNEQESMIVTTEKFQKDIREEIQKQKPIVLASSYIDEQNMFLRISMIVSEVLRRIMKAMEGVKKNEVRQIRTELIQKIVGLINSLSIDIDNELTPFCLTVSRSLKSTLHTCAVILLTKYYYDEQEHHFQQTLSELDNRKKGLKEYFINMVVPNASSDQIYAINLGEQFKEHLIQSFIANGQPTIDDELKQYDCLNRKWIQDRCDGNLLTNNDMQWFMDYIENPNKIIEIYFKELWDNVQHQINRKLTDRKTYYKNILTEFFDCLQAIIATVNSLGGPAVRFVDDIFQSEESNSLDAHQNLINKKRCMVILLHKYFSGQLIPSSYDIDTKAYKLKNDTLDSFQLLVEQRKPGDMLATMMKEKSSIYDNISIGNLIAFLQCLLGEKEKMMNDFNQVKSDFDSLDTRDTYGRLWDEIHGCSELCPCCKRPCDVDHSEVKSAPGSKRNEHRCTSGHALRAMNGYKFEVTQEASLLMCEQIKDDQIIVIDQTRYKWSEFKSDHSDWIFESALNDNELNRLHGKFLTIWAKIGRELCRKYDMIYVTYNTSQNIIHESCHYILLLDGSGSMHEKNKWKDLMDAVQEFLTRRRVLNKNDRITIIVFSDTATIAYRDVEIQNVDVSNITFPDGGTNFSFAFKCVNEYLRSSRTNNIGNDMNNNYAIVFMTDGGGEYPEHELQKLLSEHSSVIKRFWTVALNDDEPAFAQIVRRINDQMRGRIHDIETSTDLIKAYAEIATSSGRRSNI